MLDRGLVKVVIQWQDVVSGIECFCFLGIVVRCVVSFWVVVVVGGWVWGRLGRLYSGVRTRMILLQMMMMIVLYRRRLVGTDRLFVYSVHW